MRAKRDYIKTPQQIGPAIGNTRTRRQSTKAFKATTYPLTAIAGTKRLPARNTLPPLAEGTTEYAQVNVHFAGSFRGSRFTSEQAVAFLPIGRCNREPHRGIIRLCTAFTNLCLPCTAKSAAATMYIKIHGCLRNRVGTSALCLTNASNSWRTSLSNSVRAQAHEELRCLGLTSTTQVLARTGMLLTLGYE